MPALLLIVAIALILRVLGLSSTSISLSDIGGFFSGIFRGVGDLASSVWSAIKSVWSFFATLADLLSGAWDWMVNGVEWLGAQTLGGLADAVGAVGWILLHGIPDAAGWVLHILYAELRVVLHDAEAFASDSLHVVERFLVGAINVVSRFAHDVWRTLSAAVNSALAWIGRAGTWLWGVVSHPDRLARWVLAPLAKLMVREWAFFARLLAALFPSAISRTMAQIVGTTEQWLAKLL